ncbi:MAG: hypothetical protein ACTS22_02610 [Phycisphaerales bacterium]
MELSEIIETLANGDNVLFLIGGTIAVVAIVFSTITKTFRTFARERTRREVAAYIAEGSMTPEQGEKLLKAGRERCG